MFILMIIAVILAFLAPILIISIVIAFNKKNKNNIVNYSEVVQNIYVYLVLIIMLLTLIIGIIGVFRTGLDLIFPEKVANTSYADHIQSRNSTIAKTLTTLSVLIVSIPIFIYHNKLAKNLKQNNVKSEKNTNI